MFGVDNSRRGDGAYSDEYVVLLYETIHILSHKDCKLEEWLLLRTNTPQRMSPKICYIHIRGRGYMVHIHVTLKNRRFTTAAADLTDALQQVSAIQQ